MEQDNSQDSTQDSTQDNIQGNTQENVQGTSREGSTEGYDTFPTAATSTLQMGARIVELGVLASSLSEDAFWSTVNECQWEIRRYAALYGKTMTDYKSIGMRPPCPHPPCQ